jgi:hypothetical protein
MGKLKIYDLDVLRPAKKLIRLGGKTIDISFIPSGKAIAVLQLKEQLDELTNTDKKLEAVETDNAIAVKSFNLAAEICSMFTSNEHAEMDKEWLLQNTDVIQLKRLIELVVETVYKSLELTDDENQEDADANPPKPIKN